MQTKKELFLNFINKYKKKKRFWGIIIIAIIILIFVLKPAPSTVSISTDTAKYMDLKQTVLATGQVTSSTDLNLSFNTSGIVKSLKVKVGDKVKKGDILATIDQGGVFASLTQARGSLLAAQARYKKVTEGSDVALAQISLDQARITENTLVDNAYQSLLNSTPEALPANNANDYNAPTITGTYSLNKEGVINIKTYASGSESGYSFSLSGLVTGSGNVTTTTPQALGNSGLYIRFPSTNNGDITEWVVSIPNKKAANYLTNYNAWQQAVNNAKSSIDQKTADLALKKAQAQGSDIDLARADIISAEGQVQAAQAKYEDTIVRAPADGTITSIDIKLGELSESQKAVITLQDISNLYVEAKINESSIANIKLGQKVSMTFDAFGTGRVFEGVVVHVDPSAVTTDGIVNYKIKASINALDEAVRAGMNADISILTAEKANVIVIPKAAITPREGKMYVNVVTGKKSKDYTEQEVQIGLLGDGNLIEITQGLSDGTPIAIVSK